MKRLTCLAGAVYALLATPALAICPKAEAPAAGLQAAPLEISYFGVSTLVFKAGDDQLLVDGYFTRPKLGPTVFGKLKPDTGLIKQRLQQAGVRRLHAILVAHAHHDHALDSADIAKLTRPDSDSSPLEPTEAIVVGTRSTANLMLASKLHERQTCEPVPGQPYRLGPFRVTAYRADHGPALGVLEYILSGDTPADRRLPAHFGAYNDEENLSYLIEYGGHRVLVHPSAGLPRASGPDWHGARPTLPNAEIVFLGIGGLGIVSAQYFRDYWRALVVDTHAILVMPIHWDRFTGRLEKGLKPAPLPLDALQITRDRIRNRQSDQAEVCDLQAFGRIVLHAERADALSKPTCAGVAAAAVPALD